AKGSRTMPLRHDSWPQSDQPTVTLSARSMCRPTTYCVVPFSPLSRPRPLLKSPTCARAAAYSSDFSTILRDGTPHTVHTFCGTIASIGRLHGAIGQVAKWEPA